MASFEERKKEALERLEPFKQKDGSYNLPDDIKTQLIESTAAQEALRDPDGPGPGEAILRRFVKGFDFFDIRDEVEALGRVAVGLIPGQDFVSLEGARQQSLQREAEAREVKLGPGVGPLSEFSGFLGSTLGLGKVLLESGKGAFKLGVRLAPKLATGKGLPAQFARATGRAVLGSGEAAVFVAGSAAGAAPPGRGLEAAAESLSDPINLFLGATFRQFGPLSISAEKKLAGGVRSFLQDIQGIDDKGVKLLRANPQLLDQFEAHVQGGISEARRKFAKSTSEGLANANRALVAKQTAIKKAAISKFGQNKKADLTLLIEDIDKLIVIQKKSNAPQSRKAVIELQRQKKFFEGHQKNGGMILDDLDQNRITFNDESIASFEETLGKKEKITAQLFADLSKSVRRTMVKAAPGVDAPLKVLQRSIALRKIVAKEFGIKSILRKDFNISNSEMLKMMDNIDRKKQDAAREYLVQLADEAGIPIVENAEFLRTLNLANPDPGKIKPRTGYALIAPFTGFSVLGSAGAFIGSRIMEDEKTAGAIVGGGIGIGVGAVAGGLARGRPGLGVLIGLGPALRRLTRPLAAGLGPTLQAGAIQSRRDRQPIQTPEFKGL